MLDTPRLVFLDMRLPQDANRQRPFPHAITEQAVVDFLQLPVEGVQPLTLHGAGSIGEAPRAKDEL